MSPSPSPRPRLRRAATAALFAPALRLSWPGLSWPGVSWLGVSLLGLLLASTLPASATTVLHLDDDALIDAADRVIHGVVVAKTAHALGDRSGYFTEYRVRVTEALKGEPAAEGTEVTFREWGARLPDGSGYWIPGAGQLELGEEVVLFLQAPDPRTGIGFTTGLSQGKFHIRREEGREPEATREMRGVALVDGEGNPIEAKERVRALADLKRVVRERLRARGR